MRTLTTSRLVLEPQVEAHAETMVEVLADPAIYAHENAPPVSAAWLRERYRQLETRCSPDGRERWLNWVVRLQAGDAIGYVQATVLPRQTGRAQEAFVAYEFNSRWWGQGYAGEAVAAMLDELAADGAGVLLASLKRSNLRSAALLRRLGFEVADARTLARHAVDDDELLMQRGA